MASQVKKDEGKDMEAKVEEQHNIRAWADQRVERSREFGLNQNTKQPPPPSILLLYLHHLHHWASEMILTLSVQRIAGSDDEKKKNGLTGGKISTPAGELKLPKTFAQYMDAHSKFRDMVEQGKGKLQWERDIPAAALTNLENLAKTDFKANLGQIIHDIYQTAHTMFSDMPQGDHKKRAKYRFASKTLMRILPADLKGEVEALIEKQSITLDLYDILGQCTWGQGLKA